MLGRVSVRPSCLKTVGGLKEQDPARKVEIGSCTNEKIECTKEKDCFSVLESPESLVSERNSEFVNEHDFASNSAVSMDISSCGNKSCSRVDSEDMDIKSLLSSGTVVLNCDRDATVAFNSEAAGADSDHMNAIDCYSNASVLVEISEGDKDSSSSTNSKAVVVLEDSVNTGQVSSESSSGIIKDSKVNGNVYSFSGLATTKTSTETRYQK